MISRIYQKHMRRPTRPPLEYFDRNSPKSQQPTKHDRNDFIAFEIPAHPCPQLFTGGLNPFQCQSRVLWVKIKFLDPKSLLTRDDIKKAYESKVLNLLRFFFSLLVNENSPKSLIVSLQDQNGIDFWHFPKWTIESARSNVALIFRTFLSSYFLILDDFFYIASYGARVFNI